MDLIVDPRASDFVLGETICIEYDEPYFPAKILGVVRAIDGEDVAADIVDAKEHSGATIDRACTGERWFFSFNGHPWPERRVYRYCAGVWEEPWL